MREALAPVQRNAVPLEPQHSSNSRGLRPLPPTPKREVVAQRILRCGKSNTSFFIGFCHRILFKCDLKQHELYTSSS